MKDPLFEFPEEKVVGEAGVSNSAELTMFYTHRKEIELRASILYENSNKQQLEARYGRMIARLNKKDFGINLERTGIPDVSEKEDLKDLEYARKILTIFQLNGPKIKMDWARLDALIECDSRNLASIINHLMDDSQKEVLRKIVEKKCVSIQECWRWIGFKTELKVSDYRYYFGYELPKEWTHSPKTNFLDNLVSFVTGPVYEKGKSNSRYNCSKTFYLIPQESLFIWYYAAKYKKYGASRPLMHSVTMSDEKDILFFDSSDFISQLPVFVGMKVSGIIKAGATKVPVSVGKRISAQMSLGSLPCLEYTISDRAYILAYLGAYAVWPKKSKSSNSTQPLPDNESLLRSMSDIPFCVDPELVRFLLANSMTNLTRQALEDIQFGINKLVKVFPALMHALPATPAGDEGEWVEYGNVVDFLLYEEILKNNWPIWIHFGRYDEVSKSTEISYPDVYERIKNPVIDGVLQMFASMGLLDFAYRSSEDGDEIRYLRITNAGLWTTGRIESLKMQKIKVDDGFHFDPYTLMITIKDTESPNIAYLNDLAEKITPNRYKITEASLLRQCKTKTELITRVERLRDYVLDGQKSVNLDLLVASLYSKVNRVKPADDNSYELFDVDPDDVALHRFLSSNSAIRKNTLRVEGWKLLVRKSFYQSFIEKLRQEGYLTESNG